MMEITYKAIRGTSKGYYILVAILAVLSLAGVYSTWLMHEHGVALTGMNNRVAWGLQIIMAVYYIGLSAGSLVVSGLYGVFGKIDYKPFARLAAYLAMLFLIAGMLSILTDQGRLIRVFIEPFVHFNLSSMFSINPGLYGGHIVLCVIYLFALFREMPRLTKVSAYVVVCWAIVVHSGTAAIFGFVPRELYQSPLLPPSFVAAALASGAAFMIICLVLLFKLTKRHLDGGLVIWLGQLTGVFVIAVLYFILIENLHRFYMVESRDAALHFLFEGFNGVLFWGGMLLVGFIVPLIIFFGPWGKTVPGTVTAAAMVVFGVLCERYIIVIPGLIHPADLFPGMEIVPTPAAYAAYTAVEGVASYTPTFLELLQAFGVLGIFGLMFVLGIKYMPLLPTEGRIPEPSKAVEAPVSESARRAGG
ncbi:MAG: polysulfide reductase NrfD [Deltaproteobacteria bacterium]|nr:polysulfide reductase NrfD [Deltaproteobacteria bacterium]MBW1881262.1 polysulfide reductase NrfD [Deltaproteobacteria bacterium]